MNKKYITNQLKEYKQLAAKLDYINNPSHYEKRPKVDICSSIILYSIIKSLFISGLISIIYYSITTDHYALELFYSLSPAVFAVSCLHRMTKYCSDKLTLNRIKMNKIFKNLEDKFIHVELHDIFDINCTITNNILKDNKEYLLESYATNNALKSIDILNFIESIEKNKQIVEEKKKILQEEKKKENKKLMIEETCSLLQNSNTINSKNISLINSIGA